jgi:YD repeat-containing protein
MDEYVYSYKDGRLEKVNSVVRGLYSSMAAMCDPASGLHTEEVFSYDNSGRISKVTRPASTTDYIYNQQGFLSKRLIGSGTNNSFEYVYDSKGNVIKETDPQGRITEYEYDSAPNPFYQHRPNLATPFTVSPNNIIKVKGAGSFVRKFEYKSNMPVRVLEDNGLTYEYHYK